MFKKSEVFDNNYNHYLNEISKVDFTNIKDRLGIEQDGDVEKTMLLGDIFLIGQLNFTKPWFDFL